MEENKEHIRIAIVEDDATARKNLQEFLARFSMERKVDFNITAYQNATDFLEGYRNNFDMVFMDIELPDGNGMDVVAKIRRQDEEVIVFFVTNMAQYAVKGYSVRAYDFIIKPVEYNNLSAKLLGAVNCYKRKQGKEIWVTNKEGKIRLNTARITYIEVKQHLLFYHTLDGVIKASGSMANAERELASENFALCNRCYLVNLRYVTLVKKNDVVVGGETLAISHLKHASFMNALNNYIAGGY